MQILSDEKKENGKVSQFMSTSLWSMQFYIP